MGVNYPCTHPARLTVYYAFPIDQGYENNHELVLETTAELARQGWSTYRPREPWTFDGGVDRRIVAEVNQAAQAACDGVVAVLPAGSPTLGVPAEIERAVLTGQPVAVISDLSGSVQLLDWAQRGAVSGRNPRQALMDLGDRICAVGRQEEATTALKVQLLAPEYEQCVPMRTYAGDAAWDLFVAEDTKIAAGQYVDVPMGIAVELPSDMWCMIVGRSSAWRRRHLRIEPSIIDAGYRGPIFSACQNIGDLSTTVRAGERVAQLIPMPLLADRLAVQVVDRLSSSDRGEAGFGSSGV